MRRLCKTLVIPILLAAAPVGADTAEDETGKSLMQQGVELFLRGLTEEIEPALKDLQELAEDMGPELQGFFAEMGPAFADLLNEVEDWSQYERPEILPNGDILIRRKPENAPDILPEDMETDDNTVDL